MHSIWAIARNTFAQALRMKIAVVIILLLLILLPIMSLIMEGDGTLLGKLQTFTSYGLALISMLLCILTIAVSTYTLNNDLKRKYIFLVTTKPIRRSELIAGKVLGIFLFNLILLALFSAILYGCTLAIPSISDAPEEQIIQAEAEFFTSRIGIKPELATEAIHQKALARYRELQKSDLLPEGMSYSQVMKELYGQEKMQIQKVDPGEVKEWEFENVDLAGQDDPDQVVFVRYKFRTTGISSEEAVFGSWRVGDLRQYKRGVKADTQIYAIERSDVIRTAREFAVPADAIASDGYLGIGLYNRPDMNRTTIIPEDLEILYKTGTFTGNYVRAVLMILLYLIFLSIMGVSLSTWLSFPVAILLCLVVYAVGLLNGFIVDAIDGLGVILGLVYSVTIRPLLWLLPEFDGPHNPAGYIVEARTIRWYFLLSICGILICVKGLIVFLAGLLIFNRREIGKVST